MDYERRKIKKKEESARVCASVWVHGGVCVREAEQHETERLGWTDTDSPRCMLGKSSIIWSDKEQKEPISPHVISSFSSRSALLVNRTLNWCLLNWTSGSAEDFATSHVCLCECTCENGARARGSRGECAPAAV